MKKTMRKNVLIITHGPKRGEVFVVPCAKPKRKLALRNAKWLLTNTSADGADGFLMGYQAGVSGHPWTRPEGEENTAPLTQLEFKEKDFKQAELIARRLGYKQTAYTSTSALWGLFCLPERALQRKGCIIKTKELGLLFVQDEEDLLMKGG